MKLKILNELREHCGPLEVVVNRISPLKHVHFSCVIYSSKMIYCQIRLYLVIFQCKPYIGIFGQSVYFVIGCSCSNIFYTKIVSTFISYALIFYVLKLISQLSSYIGLVSRIDLTLSVKFYF